VQNSSSKNTNKHGGGKQANKVKIYQVILAEFKNMLTIRVITIINFINNNN
jgi:hypothetical protein